MPHAISIAPPRLTLTYWGKVSAQDLLDVTASVSEQLPPGEFDVLADSVSIRGLAIAPDEMDAILDATLRVVRAIGRGRTAFLIREEDRAIGTLFLVRLRQALTAYDLPVRVFELFTSQEEALAWLAASPTALRWSEANPRQDPTDPGPNPTP